MPSPKPSHEPQAKPTLPPARDLGKAVSPTSEPGQHLGVAMPPPAAIPEREVELNLRIFTALAPDRVAAIVQEAILTHENAQASFGSVGCEVVTDLEPEQRLAPPTPEGARAALLEDLLQVAQDLEGLTECNCSSSGCEGTCSHSMAAALVEKANSTGLTEADLPALLSVCEDALGLTECNCAIGGCEGTCTHGLAQAALAAADHL